MTLDQAIIQLLTKDGVAAVVAFFLSQFVPMFWPGFESLSEYHKRITIILICVLTPLIATVVGILINVIPDGSTSMIVQNLTHALEVGFAAFLGSQYAHARKQLKGKTKE